MDNLVTRATQILALIKQLVWIIGFLVILTKAAGLWECRDCNGALDKLFQLLISPAAASYGSINSDPVFPLHIDLPLIRRND